MQRQIEYGLQNSKNVKEHVFTDLVREGEDPIKLNLGFSATSKPVVKSSEFSNLSKSSKSMGPPQDRKKAGDSKKRSALEDIMEEEKRTKEIKLMQELEEESKTKEVPWLKLNIVVKVVTKDLGSKYYKEKGVVVEIRDGGFSGLVKLLNSDKKLKLDQSHLETVVPSVGREVKLVNGRYVGSTAVLESIQVESFSATINLDGKIIRNIPYEHFSKFHTARS